MQILRGKIRGKTVELDEDPGLADGQEVEVTLRTALPSAPGQPGAGFLRTEGALADDPHWDAIMEGVHRERKQASSPTGPEALAALRRAAGAWAGDDEEELERFLEWNRQERKRDTRREIPE